MLPATALAEETEETHTHDVGGTSVAFTAWDEISSLPNTEGNYYLTKNVTITETWYPKNGVVLCLNGFNITRNSTTEETIKDAIRVNNNVNFTLTDCRKGSDSDPYGKITHAADATGRGVFVCSGGTFTMYGGSITENTASTYDGGGVYVSGNQSNHSIGKFIMNGGTITKNTANGTNGNANGGGVYVTGGEFTMNGGAITENTAQGDGGNGGGVAVCSGGTVTMTGGSITGNNARTNGGGVYVAGSTTVAGEFTMTGGSITGNNANDANANANGGGVWANDYGTITVSGAVQITGNVKGGTKDEGSTVYTGGTTNNVYLRNGKTITIGTDGLTADAEGATGAKIGVTTQSWPGSSSSPIKIATGAAQDVNYNQIFTPDVTNNNYMVTKKNERDVWNLYLGPHTHSWTYSESGATVTATCTGGCGTTGSVTIKAPNAPEGQSKLVYDGQSKAAAVDDSSKWPDAAVSGITYYRYTENGGDSWVQFVQGSVPTNAGKYKATATVDGDKEISVEYTIQKADPKASDFTFTAPSDLTYNGSDKIASLSVKDGISGMGAVTVKYFKGGTQVNEVKDAGEYTVKISVAADDNYNGTNDLTDSGWTFTIGKVDYPNTSTLTVEVPADMVSDSIYLPLPMLKGDARYDNTVVTSLATKTGESNKTLFPDNSFIWDMDGTGVTFKTNSVPAGYSATMTFHIHGGTNYNDYDFIVPVSVVARTQKTLAVSMDGWTYGSTANTPQYTKPEGIIGEPTITYAKKNADGSFTELTTAPTDAGDYKVTVVCETPFVTYSGSAEFSIAKRSSSSSSSPSYSVTTPDKTENGSVTVSPKNAKQGSTVTITVTPDAGYVLGDLGVTDKNGKTLPLTKKSDTQYTFTMPTGGATVKASFGKDSAGQTGFADVKSGDYFYDAVRWAVEKGVTNGTDATHFSPDANCTRAQIVTFLWRAAGSPEPKGVSGFADVAEGSYYAKAVAWAVEQGITNGTDATHFSPDASCTRAQSVTFLYRALGQKPGGQAAFADVPAESYYADAVAWAAEQGITNGTDATHFSPNAVCTRAQIVTFLYRAYQGK